ncbi:hypothetical protein CXB51_032488 [Gossypium anomalum]|uniref:Uncharacterized protein n=1 Tax=Gossypium anomalum TaxID=47600 RepID=A0A8J5XSP4_9ROSI|nr:hypothetical protein CXB51_032488 [Gossypium anomalum]
MLGGVEETCRSRRFVLEMMLDSFNQSFLLKGFFRKQIRVLNMRAETNCFSPIQEFIRPIGFDDHVNLGCTKRCGCEV